MIAEDELGIQDEDSEEGAVRYVGYTRVIVRSQGGGRAPDDAWKHFLTDATLRMKETLPGAFKMQSKNNCRHCRELICATNKIEVVKMHLLKCQDYRNKVDDGSVTPLSWYKTTNQTTMRDHICPAVTSADVKFVNNMLACFFFETGTAFQRIENDYLKAALQR